MTFESVQLYQPAAAPSPFPQDNNHLAPNATDPSPLEDQSPAATLSPFPEEAPDEILWRQQMAQCEIERRRRQLEEL